MNKYVFSSLPYDVELLIFRYLHKMKMNEVFIELKEEKNILEKLMKYIHNSYPIEFMNRLINSSFFQNRPVFYKNKILRFMR